MPTPPIYLQVCTSACLLILCLAAPSWAGLEEAIDATERGDHAAAVKEWLPLAQKGLPEAQYILGVNYLKGLGVQPDPKESARWMQRAAEGGYVHAQSYVGAMYAMGKDGYPVNFKEAERFSRLAAEQGDKQSMAYLGSMYTFGRGVPQDFVLAHMWFNLAGTYGDNEAQQLRDEVALKMTPAQIAEAQQLARVWKPKAPPAPR